MNLLSRYWLEDEQAAALDWRAVAVLLVAPALLTWREYFGSPLVYVQWLGRGTTAASAVQTTFAPWLWWSGTVFVTLFVIPALLAAYGFGQSLRDYGVGGWNPRAQVPLALAMYAVVLPAILMASTQPGFRLTYPLCPTAALSLSSLLLWELLYIAQFFAVEFFFRGFLIFGLERSIGPLAIAVSTVPYCMLHYGKPALEAFAAIVAGVVLGLVSYRTRSLWSGLMVHVLVALTMDLLALHSRQVAWLP